MQSEASQSQLSSLYLAKVMAITDKSLRELFFKKILKVKILRMRSYAEVQYAQNDTNCSSLACVLKSWPFLTFFFWILIQEIQKNQNFEYEVIWRTLYTVKSEENITLIYEYQIYRKSSVFLPFFLLFALFGHILRR
jgi:hypothetical protein